MRVLLDDGLIEMVVSHVIGRDVHCRVIFGGELKERKGVNVPGAHFDIPCLTEKDLVDLEFGIKHKVDYVALSYVRHENDILALRKILEKNNADIRVCAKIEMLEALDRLEQIVSKSDAVMVARGDLAVEVGQTQLPQIQKHLIDLCNRMAKPVITATQMLESMTKNPRPTRAEVTDVANAVLDGSDALMLSAESASGKYPVIAVKTMHEVICEVEKSIQNYYKMNLDQEFLSIAEGIAASACMTALKLNAKAIVCLTTSGKTARMIAAYRPKSMLIAATHKPDVLNKLEIIWGLQTIVLNSYTNSDDVLEQIEKILLSFDLVEQGDIIVLTLGMPVVDRGTTNSLRVYTIKGTKKSVSDQAMPLRFKEKS
jgi:pyruvate kinase